ncbi:MAG: COX15/CtaA family protein, partial [Polynucleobacter sp.]|nr:COX15/CtaA family protein [Polynucleobacter sp.]
HEEPKLRTWAIHVMALLALQVLTGISNVVFQWPLLAALLHTAGAAALVLCLVRMGAWSAWNAPLFKGVRTS